MSRQRKMEREDGKRLRDHKFQAEDERGWAGQHGQRPANEAEGNFRVRDRKDAEVVESE